MSKTCRSCLNEKELCLFPIDGKGKDGHRNDCKSCRNAYRCNYYFGNREKYLEEAKTRYFQKTEGKVKRRYKKI